MKTLPVLIAIGSCLAAACVQAAVTDEKVRMWVSAALEGRPSVSDTDAKEKLTKVRKYQDSLASWKLLKECRDSGLSLDLNLASAEHYLFIRSFAAQKGELDIEALPALYGDVKEALGPVAQLLRTSKQPVSLPDPGVVQWGNMGVAAGLSDYKSATSKDPKPKNGQVEQYKLALEGYYENYTQTVKNPSCKVKP